MNNAIKKPTKRILDKIEQYGYKWDYDSCKYSFNGFKLQGKIQNYIVQVCKNYDHIIYYRFYIYNIDKLKNSTIPPFLSFECGNLNVLEKCSKEYLEILKKLDFKYISKTEPFSFKYIKYRFLYIENEIHLIAPPHRNSRKQSENRNLKNMAPTPVRDEAIDFVRGFDDFDVGIKAWKLASNYHRRSLVENSIYRLKRIFGESLREKSIDSQNTILSARCAALNKMTSLGMPDSFVIN